MDSGAAAGSSVALPREPFVETLNTPSYFHFAVPRREDQALDYLWRFAWRKLSVRLFALRPLVYLVNRKLHIRRACVMVRMTEFSMFFFNQGEFEDNVFFSLTLMNIKLHAECLILKDIQCRQGGNIHMHILSD